ncbi:MAG: prephenate dehydrogenase/arogenate dehydrogenase family protein, partial [Pseudomonadota bacterium]
SNQKKFWIFREACQLIEQLTIIGVGLIGGSLARALRRVSACSEVVGCSRREPHLQEAVSLGVIDRYTTDMAEAVKDADVVLVAVPLGAMGPVFDAMRDALPPHAIVTDGGSAKGSVVEDARANLGEHFERFVPAHPIAGTEQSGVSASFAELFENRRVVLTPVEETDAEATAKVRQMWELTGAVVSETTVEHHDKVLAATSHLPHMLAYTLVDMLALMETREEIFEFAAGGFRDFTRIAASDPVMWHDICMANSDALLAMLNRFSDRLDTLKTSIQHGDSEVIRTIFERAKRSRDGFVENQQENSS